MKGKQKPKRALITSLVSLALSCTLLVGTTFAWFTDSVTNTGNVITAGNLSIDAIAYDLDMTSGDKAYTIPGINNGEEIRFETTGQDLKDPNCSEIISETLWEPGRSNAKLLEVKNSGNLAAKIKLQFDVQSDSLMNALWFDFVQVDDNGNATGTFARRPMSELQTIAQNLEFHLKAEETIRFVLVYGMNETAGNEYQKKKFKADVTIIAAQDTVEADGFGNTDYDEKAIYPVTNNDELTAAIESAQSGDTILLNSGKFQMASGAQIPAGVTLAGSGPEETKITVPKTSSGSTNQGLIIDQPGVTIKDATISLALGITNSDYAGAIVVKEGGVVLDNIVIEESSFDGNISPILVTGSDFGEGDVLTISNSKIKANFRAVFIVDGTNGKVVIDNCDITGTYTFNVNSANSQNLEIEVKDSALHGWTSYGNIKSASFTNTSFSQGESSYNFMRPYIDTTFNGCTFGERFLIGAGNEGKTYTFTSCKFADGAAVAAGNIWSELLDPTGDDTKLLECTIVVDGAEVPHS